MFPNFTDSEVLVLFIALVFSNLYEFDGLFERVRAPSQSQKDHFPHQNEALKRSPKITSKWSLYSSHEYFVTTCDICRSVGKILKRVHVFVFLTKWCAQK